MLAVSESAYITVSLVSILRCVPRPLAVKSKIPISVSPTHRVTPVEAAIPVVIEAARGASPVVIIPKTVVGARRRGVRVAVGGTAIRVSIVLRRVAVRPSPARVGN